MRMAPARVLTSCRHKRRHDAAAARVIMHHQPPPSTTTIETEETRDKRTHVSHHTKDHCVMCVVCQVAAAPSTVGSHVRRRTRTCGVVVEWRMSMSGAEGEGRIDVLVWQCACCQPIGDDTQPWQVWISVRDSCSCTYTLPSRTTPRRSSRPSRHPSPTTAIDHHDQDRRDERRETHVSHQIKVIAMSVWDDR